MRVAAVLFLGCVAAAAEPEIDPKELPRFAAVEASAAVGTFQIREGFRIELAAGEPNVASPVAISFDEAGRMYVVEMRDYSEHREESLGRIRRLEDLDGDGVFEKSVVFAEKLSWPTAVICYDGGVFVGATPDILFLRDTDGDGKADERRVVFTGFGEGVSRLSVQQLLNSFNWGLDNRIHGATGGNGGTIRQVASGGAVVKLGMRDFSFDPRTLLMRAETGGGQHGFSFDDFGRKFVSNNSSHIRMAMYEDRYLRGTNAVAVPAGLIDIAKEGPAAEVFRISPEEPWRTVRTRWRVAGDVPGPIEGGGRASGYFTGATGVTIYRGDAFGPEFLNNAFIGDAGGNLVHRKILSAKGVGFEAARPGDELNREFLASRDTWVRPVQFANGPDGCLYVIDMYREVIEHPWSLPPGIKKHLDLDSGRERGRIWRIAPKDFKQPGATKFGTTAEWAAGLEHANGWVRDTAARLIYQRQDMGAVEGLRKLLKAERAQTRVHAIHALAGLGVKGEWFEETEPAVIEHELLWMEGSKTEPPAALAESASARVRYQLAWTAGGLEKKAGILAKIIATDASDSYVRAAVLVSAGSEAPELFRELVRNAGFLTKEGAVEFLAQLAARAPGDALEEAMGQAVGMTKRAAAYRLAAAVFRGERSVKFKELATEAAATFSQGSPETQRAALALLLLNDPMQTDSIFTSVFMQSSYAAGVRMEALRALVRNPAEAAGVLWKNWDSLPTGLRQGALDLLMTRGEGFSLVIEALKKNKITRADLTAAQTQALRQHPNAAIARAGLELLGQVNSDRAAVIEKYRPALGMRGDVKSGEKIFTERCAVCHRLAGKGQNTGPDLESVRGNGKEYLLIHFLDPNREVNARFVAYTADVGEESVTGILARENETAVTLRLASGEEKTIPRGQVKKLTASAQSLMPAGLEEGLDVAAVAGLLEYVLSARP